MKIIHQVQDLLDTNDFLTIRMKVFTDFHFNSFHVFIYHNVLLIDFF